MAKAKKLPSGNWRVNLFISKENGKRQYKSFTAETAKEAEYMALEYSLLKKEQSKPDNMTVGEAMDKYIEAKSNVLSPTTIKEYKRMRKNDFDKMINARLIDVTQEKIQIQINELSATHSPKYVRNSHCFLSAVLKMYHPFFKLNTTLPKKIKPNISIPAESEVAEILNYAKGTVMEAPLYLAACCGLRRSEIVGLKWDCVNLKTNTIRIIRAKVRAEENKIVEKSTKSSAGIRTVRIYPFVAEILKSTKRNGEYVTSLSGDAIYNRFNDILIKLEIKHYRFHDLRHYTVSVMLSLNIPKKYIAEHMGHETETMIDNVYGHIMSEKKNKVEDQLEEYFCNIMQQNSIHATRNATR